MKNAYFHPKRNLLGVLILVALSPSVFATTTLYNDGKVHTEELNNYTGTVSVTNGSIWQGSLSTYDRGAEVYVEDGQWEGSFTQDTGHSAINISSKSKDHISTWGGDAELWGGDTLININNAEWIGDLKEYFSLNDVKETLDISLVNGSVWKGDATIDTVQENLGNNANFNINDSTWLGRLEVNGDADVSVNMVNSSWLGGVIEKYGPVVNVALDNSAWYVGEDSNIQSLALKKSIIDTEMASLTVQTLSSDNGVLIADSSSDNALNVGSAQGNLGVMEYGTIGETDTSNAVLNVKSANNAQLNVTGETEHGLYAYKINEESGSYYFRKSGRISNANSTIQSMSAAPTVMVKMQNDALTDRQGAVRLSPADDGGIWLSYFGGINRSTTSDNASFKIHMNGVMLGGDSLFTTDNGNWLAGVAMSAVKGNLNTLNSGGDIKSYGVSAYLSRQYNNGMFVDTSLNFYNFSNSADIRVMYGHYYQRDYSQNGFGATLKAGYHYQNTQGLFIEPYARFSAMTTESVNYKLADSTVNNDAYNSVQGEIGGKLGMKYAIQSSEINPYIQISVLNEFANGNKVHLDEESVNSSIDNTAVRMGAGVQTTLTDNIGAFVRLSYLKGRDTEEPLQGSLGVNVTW
ncbi:TPA: autotransporter outer membrane beta-barrel domain-containing protein [Escherichia fergusonii]|uniref:autotransporter outer membrane beta-barrel domain-containing protein n=1 Tax=Escherichia fergusonii TaxID=564 RepID=UPI00177A30F6|nr:autotransporter outer membrane beta-barrel domain-containing protein [Escherichia fergusonii]HCO8236199.1 autotransporter outer membrane beta-barrel domain-containing protein [Escherichia fergusonii]